MWLQGQWTEGEQILLGARLPLKLQWTQLAEMEMWRGDYSRSQACFGNVTDPQVPDSPHVAALRARLAFLEGDIAGAEKILGDVRKSAPEETDPDKPVGWHLRNTAVMIALARGKYSDAVALLPTNPLAKKIDDETILAMNGRARAHLGLGDLRSAEQDATSALRASQKVWGEGSIPAIDSTCTLAEVRTAQHDAKHALELILACERERRRVYEPEHPLLADTLEAEARLDVMQGDRANALRLAHQALQIRGRCLRRYLGEGVSLVARGQVSIGDNPWLAMTLLTEADVYAASGAVLQAMERYDKAIPVLATALGAATPVVQQARARAETLKAKLQTATPQAVTPPANH
jgi:tetratricopeptide (TPR) repeat protein